MEATALSVGKSVLNGALGYAKSAFAEEVALQLGVQRDHAFVADELEMMQSFMMEAHEKRDDSKVSQTWVKQVRDTAYDVEDSLQDFAVHLKRPSWWRFPSTLLQRRRVAKQMKELRAKVEDVSQRNARYRLTQGSGSGAPAAKQSNLIAASIFSVDDARRAAKKENRRVDLIQLISKEGEDFKVIAVWGTSGDLGMMSIIREAYENPDVQTKFPGRAWVRVMHPFCAKAFVQSLVNQFHAAEGVEGLLETENTEKDLAHKFNEYINEKRCLIVFNDLSIIEEWDQIRKCFQNNKNGSRIIVSTEKVEVASLCAGQESQALELKQVSADQTLYAFYEKALRNGMDSTKPESSLDVATRGINDHAAVPREIIDDQYKVAGKKKVDVKSLTTCAGVLEASVQSTSDVAATSSKNHMLAPADIIEEQSKDADEKKVPTKSFSSANGTSVGALKESQLIGREKEISEIIELISKKDSQQGQVISVWGMGGLGKTTLVYSVYERLKLSDKFDKCVFATVKRPFVPSNLLKSLVEQLHEEILSSNKKGDKKGDAEIFIGGKNKTVAMSGDHRLTQELEQLLKMKSCLIVLDDLSSAVEWDWIRQMIPFIEKESKIIVTTREENIAKYCSGKYEYVYNLKVLENSDALDLFTTKVFEKATNLVEKNPEFDEEAHQILKKCEGLPLAILTIGGFLAKQPKTLSEWKKLNENISAELELNPELNMIRTVLEKSYDGLPYDLKLCFLYLSIFPEDCTISRRRLVRRWMAEGYSNERHGRSSNEMADHYFTELKSRSMILPSQQSVHSIKSIDSCKVHDLIREIGISKSVEENLVFRLEEGCNLNTHGAIRHLSIQRNWEGDQSELESTVDLSRIRSLTVFGQWKEFFISDKMRFLRVLDLENTVGLVDHHLDHIGKLLHLKYLSLRGCDDMYKLPDSLGNLRQLQTLDIRDTSICALPKTIIKLRKLHYIHAGQKSEYVPEEGTSLMTRCQKLLKLVPALCAMSCVPSCMGTAAFNRRDTCTLACCVFPPAIMMGRLFDGVTVPRGIRKLKDLHTLRVVNVGLGNAVLQDIKKLTGLRKLGVTGVNKKNAKAFCIAVSNLSRLESLSVRSAGKNGLCGCLNNISSPPKKLQSLELYGNLETLPEWIKKLQHLVKLELGSTRLPEHDAAMEFIGELPELEILGLSGPSFQVQELRFQSEQAGVAFGSLRVLKLEEISDTKSVKFEEGTMPKLERLLVKGLINNEIVFSGLEFLSSISKVQLHVYFPYEEMVAFDDETWNKIFEEHDQEERRKKAELKKEIQEQLAGNTNQPIVTVD